MNFKRFAGITGSLLVASLILSPATTFAGTVKAKCQAEAKAHKIGKKDMKAYMKKCYAEHKAKKAMKEEKK